jgi:V/A-type H+-transporting ATPase subunit E
MAEEGVEKIKRRVLDDAEEEKKGIISEAKGKVAEIRKEYSKKEEKQLKEIARRFESDAKTTEERIISLATLEQRMELLRAKDEVIKEAFERAEASLKKEKKNSKRYCSLLCRWIEKNAKGDWKEAELITSKGDAHLFTKRALEELSSSTGKKITLSKSSRDMIGGVILRIPEKNIEINGSFDAKLEAGRDELIGEIAKLLL